MRIMGIKKRNLEPKSKKIESKSKKLKSNKKDYSIFLILTSIWVSFKPSASFSIGVLSSVSP